jgi:hydrogenase maturation protein HypF
MSSMTDRLAGKAAAGALLRRRIRVRGIVQGVGFRPFVYALAHRFALAGFVGNDSDGVFIEVEGPQNNLEAFVACLVTESPPLAHVEEVASRPVPVQGAVAFVIVASEVQADARTLISADLFTCADCLRELFDPADRRYLYPFINCTNCGPRFTIIRDIPYDRPRTTMADFAMCSDCEHEYRNPSDRRYHAQPIACPRCGPRVWLERRSGDKTTGDAAAVLAAARAALEDGAILAVKGLGGFHLACSATDEDAVARLRLRKGREGKPFALMVRDLAGARNIAVIDDDEARSMQSPERPVVIVSKLSGELAASVSPGNDTVGIMLPYTPLHYMLVGHTPLVMTSGNLSGAPIEIDNDSARMRLDHLADALLLHDRGIHVPCDDSVVRVFQGAELPVRRSRGYAPFPVRLPFDVPPVLAVGGELKSTVCVTTGKYAILSQHIGDMGNLETLEAFGRIAGHLQSLFRVTPERIACDMHPGYYSRQWAVREAERRSIPLVEVQHHHAHIAAVMAEHQHDGSRPVIGISFDGTGYGLDGAIWGGEVLIADYHGFRRAAHLKYIPLPGGDGAVRHPYRAALAFLWSAGIPWDDDLPPVRAAKAWERQVLRRQLESGLNCVPCSSMGRLFDAVASLLGIRQSVSYEAQAAIEMEALLSAGVPRSFRWARHRTGRGCLCVRSDCPGDWRSACPDRRGLRARGDYRGPARSPAGGGDRAPISPRRRCRRACFEQADS